MRGGEVAVNPVSTCIVRIERMANGYEVEITDPEIVKANESSKDKWRDPNVSYAFKTPREVVTFLSRNLEKALPLDDYTTSFDKAANEEEDDD